MLVDVGRFDLIEATPPTMDDVYMTAAELAARWRCDVNTLANLRARGEGLPFVKRGANGGVLYKIADVLAFEARGTRGFTWARLANAVDAFPGLVGSQRQDFIDHLKRCMRN